MNAATLDRSALADVEPRPTRKLQVRQPLMGSSPDPLRIRFGPIELDEGDARLTVNGQAVPLPPKPFSVLCVLARAPQKLLTTNALARCRMGTPVRHRLGPEDCDQRAANGARRRPETAALHRDGSAARLSLYRCPDWHVIAMRAHHRARRRD